MASGCRIQSGSRFESWRCHFGGGDVKRIIGCVRMGANRSVGKHMFYGGIYAGGALAEKIGRDG